MARTSKPAVVAEPPSPPVIRGNIDRISADGILFGWCLDDAHPGARMQVTLLADGSPIGHAIASSFRQDLMDAGVGDGRHGFTYTLPMDVLRRQRVITISACHRETGFPLDGAVTWRAEKAVTFDDRLAKVEADLLLLRDRMQATTTNDAAIATLFDAVGTFFARLGQDLRDGRPSAGGIGMSGRVDAIAHAFADIPLPLPASPRAAILLTASGDIATLHHRLAAIADAELCREADVFLLDDETVGEAALLPAVVRNLRYLRLRDDAVAERDSVIRTLRHEIVIWLDASIPVTGAWLDGLAAALAVRDGTGLIGIAPGNASALSGAAAGAEMSVAAVDAAGFAMRGAAYEESGGLDAGYGDIGVAVIDLCYRLRTAGWAVDAYPAPDGLRLAPPSGVPGALARSRALLAHRWPRADDAGGTAACVMTEQSDMQALAAAIGLLRRHDDRPLVLCTVPREDAAALEAALLPCHVETIWCGSMDRVAPVLAGIGRAIGTVCVPSPKEAKPLSAGLAAAGLNPEVLSIGQLTARLQADAAPGDAA